MHNGYVLMLIAIVGGWSDRFFFFSCTVKNYNDKTDSALSSSGILKNIVKHAPRISAKEINESEIKIAKMAHEDENRRLEKMEKCVKDYTLPCPKFWEKKIMNKSENVCIASSGYNGFCDPLQSFDNFTQNEKMEFETSCNVEWGCKNVVKDSCESGKRNYNEPCPEGFILQNDNTCKADITVYKGMCSTDKINFSYLTSSEKKNWSVACEAYWPCYINCTSNNHFLSTCPSNWRQINTYECVPPESYKGPCKKAKNFKFFTKSMKIKFEEKCKVTFECHQFCEKNYEQEECPLNWIKEKGYCLAPKSFDMCDKKKLSYENLTKKEKENFESECSVHWPCQKTHFCEMNWNSECPLNWKKDIQKERNTQSSYVCIVDSSMYEGKCTHISLPNTADEETKRELASMCDTPWPCLHTHINGENKLSPSDYKLNEHVVYTNENGPLTYEGGVRPVRRTPVYHIVDEQRDFSFSDIMR
ncbi:CPW-WPC family protein [Plasmodium gonderi]|uniref:CPW-WPC family protein n=1 Tax=Plasmodium gonderi TaxID=77519 RepID=A0A1Y1JN39_PLAGO|nr:CPW-WPC family protein [Plasmodium gonderi]GAW82252.1 CPW-WPC family protein [Plasmodium gonderi]